MKNFLKILILPVAVVMMFGGFAPKVLAVDPMTAVFAPNPIFGAVLNFLPGDIKTGTVTVANNTEDPQSVYAESVNGSDPDGFGSQLRLRVLEGETVLYDDIFSDFLSTGPVPLSELDDSETTTYTFKVSFIDSEDNDYQGKSLGFDLCIGFSDGTFQCGDTVIGDEEPVDEGDPPGGVGDGGGQIPGGSGGGSSGGFIRLIISNESVLDINEVLGTATIQWNTNLLATSQVVYGSTSDPTYPFTLNLLALPNLGYPLGTIENGTKVLNHSVTLTGLAPGTYVYRVVSRASPPTVSVEHTFTMPTKGAGNLIVAQARPIGDTSEGGPVKQEPFLLNSEEATSTGEAEAEAENNNNLLAFALGGLNFDLPGLICVGVALLIFLVFLGLLWLIYQKKKDRPLAGEIALLIVFGLVASGILWLIPYTCPIIPLWVIVAIYVIWKLISKWRSTRSKLV